MIKLKNGLLPINRYGVFSVNAQDVFCRPVDVCNLGDTTFSSSFLDTGIAKCKKTEVRFTGRGAFLTIQINSIAGR